MRVAVAGSGYVGMSLAVLLAARHDVTVVDVVPAKVEQLNAGTSPIRDADIERALAAAQATDGASLRTGVEMILKQMRDAYTKLGVTEVNRMGEKFDPNVENAVMQGTPDEGEPGTVCMVLQKGYVMGKTVLREAMVKVVPD